MKNNNSLLDMMLAKAENVAETLKASRSQLDTQAFRGHKERLDSDNITNALNYVYLVESSELDGALCCLQTRSLPDSKW